MEIRGGGGSLLMPQKNLTVELGWISASLSSTHEKNAEGLITRWGPICPLPTPPKLPPVHVGDTQPSKNLVFGQHQDFRGRLIPQELPGVWGREARAEEASRRTCRGLRSGH